MNEYVISALHWAPSNWMEEVKSKDISVITVDMPRGRFGKVLMLIKCSENVAKQLDDELKYLKVEYVCPDEMFGCGK